MVVLGIKDVNMSEDKVEYLNFHFNSQWTTDWFKRVTLKAYKGGIKIGQKAYGKLGSSKS